MKLETNIIVITMPVHFFGSFGWQPSSISFPKRFSLVLSFLGLCKPLFGQNETEEALDRDDSGSELFVFPALDEKCSNGKKKNILRASPCSYRVV